MTETVWRFQTDIDAKRFVRDAGGLGADGRAIGGGNAIVTHDASIIDDLRGLAGRHGTICKTGVPFADWGKSC